MLPRKGHCKVVDKKIQLLLLLAQEKTTVKMIPENIAVELLSENIMYKCCQEKIAVKMLPRKNPL